MDALLDQVLGVLVAKLKPLPSCCIPDLFQSGFVVLWQGAGVAMVVFAVFNSI